MTKLELYLIEGEEIEKIRQVISRLYDGQKLTYDNRRDLAAMLDHVLDHLIELEGD